MERVPTVNNCCWFFDVETGTKIIGYVQAIVYAIWFTLDVIGVIQIKKSDSSGQSQYWGATIFGIVLNVFMFLIACLLLMGVYKHKQLFVKTWLIVQSLILILMVIQLVLIILTFSIGGIISHLISICVLCYFMVVVLSYYRGMPTNTAAPTY
uniref:Putative conserved plasma membrane protein n=1 Tax=Panstrongylus lignarius TaxID=156445 RepID=A0A224XN04_9HEMI